MKEVYNDCILEVLRSYISDFIGEDAKIVKLSQLKDDRWGAYIFYDGKGNEGYYGTITFTFQLRDGFVEDFGVYNLTGTGYIKVGEFIDETV